MDKLESVVEQLKELHDDYSLAFAEEMEPYREKLQLFIDFNYDGNLQDFIDQNLKNSDYYYLIDFVENLYFSDDVFAL